MTRQHLRDELIETSRTLAWAQWTDLGGSSWEPQSNKSLIDLESLIAFTAQLWDRDPRLGAQSIDWIAQNVQLVSRHQLRGVVTRHRWSFQGAFADFSATAERFTHKKWPGKGDAHIQLRSLPNKSRPPDLTKPSLLTLRSRAIFGLGARAETIRHLLYHDWPQTATQVAREIPYGARQVANDLELLRLAGIVLGEGGGKTQSYALAEPKMLYPILGAPIAHLVPWGPIFKLLTELMDLFNEDFTALHSPNSEFARRLRFVEPELRLLNRERWWIPPGEAVRDGLQGWVQWFVAEVPNHLSEP